MAGAVLQRVVSAEALAVLCQRARDFRRSTSAWAVGEAWRALVGTAMDPRAPSSRGKRQGVGDGWEARACDDGAHGLGTAEDTSLLGLLQTRVERGEGVIGKVQCEGAPEQGLHNKVLQKYQSPMSYHVLTLLSAHNLSNSNFPEAARYSQP